MNTVSLWRPPFHWVIAAHLDLIQGEVIQELKVLLSDEERLRADRFRRQPDQQRYVLAHGLKRFCLSKIIDVEPDVISFKSGEKGKPFCDHPAAPEFNISHSGDWVLLGVSSKAEIGVDVEMISRQVSEAVTQYALTPNQLKEVELDEKPDERFMFYWTQKEAISKALGLGLSIDFQTVECTGKSQQSHVNHSDQGLTVWSRLLNEYVVSIASIDAEEPAFYRLVRWRGDELIFNPLSDVVSKA